MSALAITAGTARSEGARGERREITRERAPFQAHMQKAERASDEDHRPPAPKKIPTKAAKKLESPSREPVAQAPAPAPAPTAASSTTPSTPPLAATAEPAIPAVAPTLTQAAATPDAMSVEAAVSEAPVRPLTPLEQALQDLVEQIQPVDAETEDTDEPAPLPAAPDGPVPTHAPMAAESEIPDIRPTQRADAPAPVTDLEKLAEMQATQAENASHVNLIIDDGDARIVLAVAVHGQDVRVAMRTGDDHIAASLARNAASLDHNLHARGMNLAELASESQQRDPKDGRAPREQRERDEPTQKQFRIEEYV